MTTDAGDDALRAGPTAPRAEVLLVGVAVRPFARSAVRSGVGARSVDWFGDRDHRRDLPVSSLRRDTDADGYSARRLVELADGVAADEVAYAADLENRPRLVGRLAAAGGRRLLGNPPEVLRRARDPFRVTAALRTDGLPVPEVRPADDPPPPDGARDRRWLRKPLRGGGGRGVRPRGAGDPPEGDAYLQERIGGRPVGVLFVGDGRRARVLAVTEMLVGREAFGASGFLYCGSLLRRGPDGRPLAPRGADATRVARRARRLADVLAGDLELRGLCGVDAILRDGELWPVEVNPRWTSSMELLETGARPGGGGLPRPLFALHRDGSAGALPPEDVLPGGGPPDGPGELDEAVGKAVVRARRDAAAPDLPRAAGIPMAPPARAASGDRPVRIAMADVPEPGDPLPEGGPVCTLLARAPDVPTCLGRMEEAAARVHRALRERS